MMQSRKLLLRNVLLCLSVLVGQCFSSTVSSSSQPSALQDPDRLRFTIVDVSIQLLSVPSLLDSTSSNQIDDVSLVTKVFLENSLNIHPTTINETAIQLVSQSLINGRANDEEKESEQDDNHNNLTMFVLSLDLQILIKYKLAATANNTFHNNMDQRIRETFTEEWEELQVLLKALDPVYFHSLHIIELAPKPNVHHQPPVLYHLSGTASKNQAHKPVPTLLIILLVIGFGVGVSLVIVSPLVYFMAENRTSHQHRRIRTISTSQTDDRPVTTSSKYVPFSESSTTTSEELPSDDHSKGFIQRIYSDDKVTNNNNSLEGLRGRRNNAEDKLKLTMRGIHQSIFDQEVKQQQTRRHGTNNISNRRNFLITSTSSTDNASDVESQGGCTMPAIRVIGATGEERDVERVLVHSSNKTAEIGSGSLRPIWIAPTIVESDQSSVSTITGGGIHSDEDDEDSEREILAGIHHHLPSTTRRKKPTRGRRTRSPSFSSSSSDEFGSIAKSNPNTPTRRGGKESSSL